MTQGDRRFPLAWPSGWPRAKVRTFNTTFRSGGQWITVDKATTQLYVEMTRLLGSPRQQPSFVLSTNMPLRQDGWPMSNRVDPADPGVAVYFTFRGQARVLACDRWSKIAQNIRAISLHIEAMRGMERWGVGTLDQAFTGYTAIPQRADGSDWRAEFGFDVDTIVTVDAIVKAFRRLAAERHPDQGGSHEAMARLNRARESALKELA